MGKELTFREVQVGACEVLKKIKEICEQENLVYFLAYGTLIGALRHKGVIPWDDDVDIIMPRPDYEKLKKYFIEHQKELYPFRLFDPSTVEAYPHMIARVSDMRYHLIFDNERDYGIGLFVDIYPFDGLGNDFEEAKKKITETKKYASLCFLTGRKSFGVDNTNSKFKMLLKVPAYVWAKIKGTDYYIQKLSKYPEWKTYEESKYVGCLVWPDGFRNGINRDVFEKDLFEPVDMEFEGEMYKVPRGYDKFLTMIYGDYMTPPPENDRKTHHTYTAIKKS